jgi:osmotically-inducible protein OsmY
VHVDTVNGRVTLYGKVVPSTNKEWVTTRDDIIRRDIKTALKTHPALKHVNVDVKSGTVRLAGTVESDWEPTRCDDCA